MTSATSDPGAAAREWAQIAWPERPWNLATVTNGAFHQVLILAGDAVARISAGTATSSRTHRESVTHRTISSLRLPWSTPEPIGDVHAACGRSGQRLSYIAGEIRQVSWSDVGRQLVEALAALREAPPRSLTSLSPPRQWCGGHEWPQIVQQRLAPQLPPSAQLLARDGVEDLLAAEETAPTHLVHGDFGLHNLLWRGNDLVGVIDWDHAACGDPAIDVAPLIGAFGARALRSAFDPTIMDRAFLHRATLPLQVAAAAALVGDEALQDHALRNFSARCETSTLYDPGGFVPPAARPIR
ncbi:phosphotransferase family protein [Ruania rhizosphaerae]|uniref:phosphotransferase family protein n=1 Tax=Ruania rhizosphaerae TaxID=1840413 RepID=UPI00135AEA56|nr:aminoglycoside phosphotransferase family protein [Ruania rhizosphaerae]